MEQKTKIERKNCDYVQLAELFFQDLQKKGSMETSDYYLLYPHLPKEKVRKAIQKMYLLYEHKIIKQPSIPRIRQNLYYMKEVYPFVHINEMNTILQILERQRKNLWKLGGMIPDTPQIKYCMEKIIEDIQNIEYIYRKKGVLK